MTQTLAADMHFLFDVDLRYHDSTAAMARPDGAGNLIGSGTGQIHGPQLHGNCGGPISSTRGPTVAQLTLVGEIETEDGATIGFDSRGFAVAPATGTAWKITAAVGFVVEDPRYQWLQAIQAVWAGKFDESNATARYRAFALDPRNGNAG